MCAPAGFTGIRFAYSMDETYRKCDDYYNEASQAYRDNRLDDALERIERALGMHAGEERLERGHQYWLKGKILLKQNDQAEALEYYRKARDIFVRYPNAAPFLETVEEVIEKLESIAEKDPE